jgi:hypothetical protein
MFPVSLGFIILIKQDFLWLIFSLSLIIFIYSYVGWNAYRCFPSVLHFSCCSNFSHCLILLDCGTQSPMSPRHVRNALAYSFLEKYPPPLFWKQVIFLSILSLRSPCIGDRVDFVCRIKPHRLLYFL